ncbi:MAG: hypothetical protein QOK03_291, partial [Candidatus Binataceae bacterium]|nr:hypothetical protein [Candidatus Binataceae bacterium]
GCSAGETGPDPDKAAKLSKGETYDQVVHDLGPPTTIKTSSDNSKIVGYSYIQPHLSGVATTEALTLKFDNEGILQDIVRTSLPINPINP